MITKQSTSTRIDDDNCKLLVARDTYRDRLALFGSYHAIQFGAPMAIAATIAALTIKDLAAKQRAQATN